MSVKPVPAVLYPLSVPEYPVDLAVLWVLSVQRVRLLLQGRLDLLRPSGRSVPQGPADLAGPWVLLGLGPRSFCWERR